MTIIYRPRLSRRAFVAAVGAAVAAAAQPASAQTDAALQIWFIRHAESEIDVLTRKGVEQAKALAEATASVPIIAIYTSTSLPAVQTADAVAFRHDLPLTLAPEAVDMDPGVKPGSESFADVQRRFLPFVREVMNRHAQDSGVVVIVAHAATIGFMVPVLATNVPAEYASLHPLPNTGIVKTELRDSRLSCLDWLGIPSEEFESKASG
jgi:broad specificity phosphatase PhoE